MDVLVELGAVTASVTVEADDTVHAVAEKAAEALGAERVALLVDGVALTDEGLRGLDAGDRLTVQEGRTFEDIERITKAFASITKASIREMTAVMRPPSGVEAVCTATCAVCGEKVTNWSLCVRYLLRPDLYMILRDASSAQRLADLTDKQLDCVRTVVNDPGLGEEVMQRKSFAAAAFRKWLGVIWEVEARVRGLTLG
eukprot:TRINITY_DN1547_c1_g1_i2.p1 TRINITY_DN1547_c1_g1~~TRINITY_DN1547_c1_g1_i2.p1  ORF type:complete len:199 (+),score=43.11 TRINITY_DN1547_c1_g1_i2:57-653(+)